MDKVATLSSTTTPPSQIRTTELLSSFLFYAKNIKILSLDCFDTILWRKTAKPTDVFYLLAQKPTFKMLGLNADMRRNGEELAYRINIIKRGNKQATLNEIYYAINPYFTEDQVKSLIEEELEAEMETCYALPATIELIRTAHAAKKKIIVVSDTYLQEAQLRQLLTSKLPSDAMAAIAEIYCSCEHGGGKGDGLFSHIMSSAKITPEAILHIGDNHTVDYTAAIKLGMHALHLEHHEEPLTVITRMLSVSASFINPMIRNSQPLLNPFHGLLASESTITKPETIIGYVAAGPIIYAFAKFLIEEITNLKQQGLKPKVLFLMRDAYLPSLVCEALTHAPLGTCVRISRFTSYAASFRTEEDVNRYLADRIKSERYEDMCNQLLLSKNEITSLLQRLKKSSNRKREFINYIHEPKTLKQIFNASKAYAERLRLYLEKAVQLQAGDTLVFVDLGYTGTAQLKLAPIFKNEFNVDVLGRYLLGLRTHDWQVSRRSLFSPEHYDDKALTMLVTYIAIFEQICTSSEKSVVDFDNDGNPIYAEASFNEEQYSKLQKIQSECIRFALTVEKFLHAAGLTYSNEVLRDAAAINLCRFLFLPTKIELDYLRSFQFDFNLGTKEILPMFDLDKGLIGLRRRSWLYSSKEDIKNMRTNYPAEWRAANIELVLTLMTQHRFGLEFAPDDLSQRREHIQILTVQGTEIGHFDLDATLTHDGYFAVLVPVIAIHQQVALRLGLQYKWLEIESAELIELAALYSQVESDHTQDATPFLSAEELNDQGGGLFECLSENSLLILTRNEQLSDENYILRVIFRPIVKKQ